MWKSLIYGSDEYRARRLQARKDLDAAERRIALFMPQLRTVKKSKLRQFGPYRDVVVARRRVVRAEARNLILAMALIVAITSVDALAFYLAGFNYLSWWIDAGGFLSVFFLVISTAADLDVYTGLIAQEPAAFLGALFAVEAELTETWHVVLAVTAPDNELAGTLAADHQGWARWRRLDRVLTYLWLVVLIGAALVWVIVIGPAQYWTNVICGAPARQALTSSEKTWVTATPQTNRDVTGVHTEIFTGPRKTLPPPGARLSALVTRPVTLTAALAAALLFALRVLT